MPGNSLSSPFVRRPVMTMLLTVTIILFGIIAYQRLPVNDLPAVDFPVINVTRQLSRREPGHDGQQRRHAAGAAVHADSRARVDHLLQHAGKHVVHAAVRPRQKRRRRRDRRAGGDQPRGRQPAGRSSLAADFHEVQSERSADHVHHADERLAARRASSTTTRSTQVAQRISILPGVSKVDIFGSKAADPHQGRSRRSSRRAA